MGGGFVRVLDFPPSYDIVHIDPPWPYYGAVDKDAAAGKHYDLMTAQDINRMPIRDLFRSKQGACFVWATGPKLDLAIDAIRAWGLHYRGVAFVWLKTRKDGVIMGPAGVPPTATKPKSEFVLLATTCRTGRPFPLLSSKINQDVLLPRTRHSEKPLAVYDRIVELYGDRPRIDVFSRRDIPGWDRWGNQAPE
jgi:N6-adenosine-specific RNA methylase IME4